MVVAGDAVAAAAPASSVISSQQIAAINDGKLVASDSGPTITGVTAAKLQQYLYELCQAVARGDLAADKFVVGVRCAGPVADGCGAAVVDVLWMVWLQNAGSVSPAAAAPTGEDGPRERLVALLQDLLKQQMVTKREVMETADDDFLEAAGLVVSAVMWHKKGIRVNTKAVYTQQKFNLLREEGEGYAKLLAALNRFGGAAISPTSVAGLVLEVKALIGYFDLDPNRAIALALQAFAAQPGNAAYLPLFRLFVPDSVAQTLGFLFQHAAESGAETPDALFAVAVSLMQAEIVSLEAVMGHLAPADDAMAAAAQEAQSALAKEIRAIGVISLAATAAEPGQQDASGQPRGPAVLSSSTLRLDVRPLAEAARAPLAANNQKLGLLAALLRAGEWERATLLMAWLSSLGVAPAAHPPVAAALATDVGRLLAPLLAAAYPQGLQGRYALDPKAARPSTPPALDAVLLERLATLGLHIAADVGLMTRLARALRFVAEYHLPAAGHGDVAAAAELAKVEEVLSGVLLPGMLLTPAVPAVAAEIHTVLAVLPYTTRYRLYSELRDTTKKTPLLSAAAKLASTELKKVLRRVHVPESQKDKKEELRKFGRMLAKIAAANPLAVSETVIAQVEAYPNMVEPYVEALRYLTPLGFDVLTFTIIDRLAGSGREKLKQDGVNIADWLTALALFTGHAAKAWPGVDVAALAQYLAHTLRAGQAFDLLLLKELVSVMTGTITVPDLSQEQVDGMAGGDALRSQTLAFGMVRNMKQLQKGAARLLAALQQGPREQQLALPLLLLLGQQLRVIALQTEAPHLKLVAELYDKASQTLLQFGDFLKASMAPADYARLLPPLEALVKDYGMDPEAAFQLYRPIIAGIEPPPPPAGARVDGKPEDGEVAAEEGEIEEQLAAPQQEPGEVAQVPGHLQWSELAASVRALLPASVWDCLPVELYTTFWSLSLYDIYVPTESYEREMTRLGAQLRVKKEAVRSAERDLEAQRRGYMVDPMVMASHVDVPSTQKEIQRIEQVLEKLPAELKAQQRNHADVAARLKRQSAHWLRGLPTTRHISDAFVLHCIMPRVKHSAADAVYCAKFIHRLHSLNTWGFSSIQVYDKVIKDMVELVLCSTDAEAANLGIFLQHTLSLMARWRGSAKVYAEECAASPCFSVNFMDPAARRTSYMEFRKLNSKWQHKLGKCFRTTLDNGEYVHIRNTLIILNKIVKVFPQMKLVTAHLQKVTDKLRESEAREDLKTQANMYFNALSQQVNMRTMYEPKEYLEDPDVVAKRRAALAATGGKSAAKPARKPAEGQAAARENGAAAAAAKPAEPARAGRSERAERGEAQPAADARASGRGVDRPSARSAAEPAERPDRSAEKAADRAAADRSAARAGDRAAERAVERTADRPADRAAGRAAEGAADRAADKAAGEPSRRSAAGREAGSGREAVGSSREDHRPDAAQQEAGDLARRPSARGDAASTQPRPSTGSSRGDDAAPTRSEARRQPAAGSSRLRPEAPEFTPPGTSPSRTKEARPAAEPPEGSAARPAKRPRTSDVGAEPAEVSKARPSSRRAAEPQAAPSPVEAAAKPAAVRAAAPSPAAEPEADAKPMDRLALKEAAKAAARREAEAAQQDAKKANAKAAAPPATEAAPASKRKQEAAAEPTAAEPEPPKRRKHEKVVFVPSDKRKREEAAAAATAPVEEDRPRGREKKARHEAEGGTEQPSPRGGAAAAAPASEFSPTVRAELAQRLGRLPSTAQAGASDIIAGDPARKSDAGGTVRLGELTDGTLRRLDSYISGQEAAPGRDKKAKSRAKSKERSEKAPKEKKSRHHRERAGDERSVRSSERGSPTPSEAPAPAAEKPPSKADRHDKGGKAEKAEKEERHKKERRRERGGKATKEAAEAAAEPEADAAAEKGSKRRGSKRR